MAIFDLRRLKIGSGLSATDLGDGVHEIEATGGGAGVDSLAVTGEAQLTGDVTLSAGTGIALNQSGNDIEIENTGGGGGGGSTVGCHVTRTAGLTVGSGSTVYVAFDSEVSDAGGWHDNSTDNTRITVPSTGWYTISVGIRWELNTTGRREFRVRKNGTDVLYVQNQPATAGDATFMGGSFDWFLTANDYVELGVLQASTANRVLEQAANWTPRFSVVQHP